MQEVQVLDVGYNSLFPDIDTIGTERIGDYVVMIAAFGCGVVSSWRVLPTYEVAMAETRRMMAKDADAGLSHYVYEIWHLVDDSVDCTPKYAPTNLLLASFAPIYDNSLPVYSCVCYRWSELLAWIGAMLPVIDMASYELKTDTV